MISIFPLTLETSGHERRAAATLRQAVAHG
jgi:hypothetical protein